MKHAIVVVDDFYDDPDAVLGSALRLDYEREEGVNYPGLMAPGPASVVPTMKRFSELLGGMDIRYAGSQGSFRFTSESDMGSRRSIVHVDSSDFSAIVHLSKHRAGGTYFYRHKALDLEYITEEANRDPEVRETIHRDTLNLDAWEVTQIVSMRFNRLVIFDGKFFHSGPPRLTGNHLRDGRLTQHFFFFRA